MDKEIYTEETLSKVYDALFDVGLTLRLARAAVNNMQNAGILFRERAREETDNCPTEQNPEHNITP